MTEQIKFCSKDAKYTKDNSLPSAPLPTPGPPLSGPPTLQTPRLELTREFDKRSGKMALTCGTLSDLGTPPVQLVWRLPNSSILDSSHLQDGTLILKSNEDAPKLKCVLDLSSSPATSCIPESKRHLWVAEYEKPNLSERRTRPQDLAVRETSVYH
ncbi:hypothetical protein ElyMa_001038400 [Elysia marginata]|uniref:Ig-like domain-containing protein n=1 Tax=Elysia marginata TaxID=1093978 RepID=A0AAV4HMT6_9GAST|nr:hypothetical protein ElyMa_001038400 [Elysia marginata]